MTLWTGCESQADDAPKKADASESGGGTDSGPLSGAALLDSVESLTGCSPYEKVQIDPSDANSLAIGRYLCGDNPDSNASTNQFYEYDSSGSLQADLSSISTEPDSTRYGIVVGDNAVIYTSDKSALAALLDAGYTLHRPIE